MFVRQHPIYKIIIFVILLAVMGGMVLAAPIEGNASAMQAFQIEETPTSTPTPLFSTPTPTLTPTFISGVLSCNTVAANVTCTNYGTYLKYDINIVVTRLKGGASATSIPIGTFKRTTAGGYLGLMTDFIHSETSNYAANKVASGVWLKPSGLADVKYPSFSSGAGKNVWVHHNIIDWRVVPGAANSPTSITVRGNVDYPITGYSVVGTIYIYSNEMFVTVTPTPTATATITPAPTETPPPSSGYNRSAAVAYADQWAHGRNSNYPLANETGCNCNDCTNYASQALHNGGYSLRTGDYNAYNILEWWYRDSIFPPYYSRTWGLTDWFAGYMTQNPTEFEFYSSYFVLEGGDFILMDLRNNDPDSMDPLPDGKPDHARVVVGWGNTSLNLQDYGCSQNPSVPEQTYTLLVNQHCPDRSHVAWDYNIDFSVHGLWYIHVVD